MGNVVYERVIISRKVLTGRYEKPAVAAASGSGLYSGAIVQKILVTPLTNLFSQNQLNLVKAQAGYRKTGNSDSE